MYKTKILCKKCYSDNILCDAYASFNYDLQKWELFDVYEDMICNDCGSKDIEEQEIEDESAAAN